MQVKTPCVALSVAATLGFAAESTAGEYLEVEPGVDIYYEVHGEGPDLVLVPGWTFTTEVFEHQISEFSKTYRVITFDPRSHGRSTVSVEGNNYATSGVDLSKLLSHLGSEQPALVGWSFGCLTTLAYLKHTGLDSASSHMCIDAPPTPMSNVEGDWVEASLSDMSAIYNALQTSQGHRDLVNWYADEIMIEGEYTPELSTWIVDQSTSSPPWVAAAYWASGAFSDYMDIAREVDEKMPSYFLVATHWADVAVPYLEANLANSRVEAFGGHMMFWEYPDRFNPILSDMLKAGE